jgi:hypothetical protein
MATVPYQVQNLDAQQADGNILLTWNAALNATGYILQRSTDGINFSTLATLGQITQYIDSLPGIGQIFYYNIIATNIAGSATVSTNVSMVAALPSEMSLGELRLRSQQTADRVNSNFVVTAEWNSFIRLAMYELYDLLITSYEDLFSDQIAFINTNGTTQNYPFPDGVDNYFGGIYPSTSINGAPSQAFYKLAGIDLAVNTSNNAWVTLRRFNFIDRNKYVYPNSTSTIYGIYNMGYRPMGKNLNIIPTPAGNQQLRLWYSPRLPALLADNDLTSIGFSGWLRYVIVRSAKYALDKEEGTDTSKLDAEIAYLKTRIEETAQNRDMGAPDKISNTRQDPIYGGTNFAGVQNAGW